MSKGRPFDPSLLARLASGSLALLVTLLASPSAAAAMTSIYVSPNGNDEWSGNLAAPNPTLTDGPLASLERARDTIRKLRRSGALPEGGVTVELLPGIYPMAQALILDARDSGDDANPIVFRAAKRGTAVLSGAVVLNDWRPVSDPKILARLDDAARKQLVWTSIDRTALEELPGFANGAPVAKNPEYPIALYQGPMRLPIARWPNEGYARTGECLGASHIAGHSGLTFTDGIFRFENDARLARWAEEPDLWFGGCWFFPWAVENIKLKTIDLKKRTIALANGHQYGFKQGQEFYAFNAISEIDRPGEWAIDPTSRRIYLWPLSDSKADSVLMARCDTLIRGSHLTNVTFDGLVFEMCRQDAASFKDCAKVSVVASTLRHVGGWAVNFDGGTEDTVMGCDLYDLGEGGASATGGDRDQLISGKHLITNNHIHHFGRIVSTYRPGASVRGVGNTISHNLIYQADHQAIFFDGNDHLIEYNIVHDVCLHTGDAGPIYTCARDWTKRGTVIRDNLIHAPGKAVDKNGCRDIYLDDYTSGTIIYSNIVTQAEQGISVCGGKDNIVYNNIVLDCRTSISLESRGIDSFAKENAKKGKGSTVYTLLLRDVYQTELWKRRYPNMLAPLNMDPIQAQNAHGNQIRANVIIGSPKVKVHNGKNVMKTCVIEENSVSDDDPGFVNMAAFDLRLRPDAPVFKRISGFRAPDFAKMGLYDDPRRATPAVKFGPGVTALRPITGTTPVKTSE